MADDISRVNRDQIEVEAEKERVENVEHIAQPKQDGLPQMDPARRIVVEKQLKRKLDARCSLFVAIYSEYPLFHCSICIIDGMRLITWIP
jgi:hypothetical protein